MVRNYLWCDTWPLAKWWGISICFKKLLELYFTLLDPNCHNVISPLDSTHKPLEFPIYICIRRLIGCERVLRLRSAEQHPSSWGLPSSPAPRTGSTGAVSARVAWACRICVLCDDLPTSCVLQVVTSTSLLRDQLSLSVLRVNALETDSVRVCHYFLLLQAQSFIQPSASLFLVSPLSTSLPYIFLSF